MYRPDEPSCLIYLMRTLLPAAIVILTLTSRADSPAPVTRFTHHHWTRDDGLPDNAAERLLQTRDGWLWIGTRSGLARFDGLKFTVYDARTPGFTSDAILDLAEDAAGNLWIATKKGLYRKQGGSFTRFTRADGLLHDQVNQILPRADGSVWITTLGGVNRLHAGRFTSFPFTETIYKPAMNAGVFHDVIALAEAEDGEFWVGSQVGLHRLAPDSASYRHSWRVPVQLDALHRADAQRLLKDRTDRLWLGGEEAIYRREGTNWITLSFPTEAGDLRIRQLREDAAGQMWAVRAGKLFRVETDSITPFPDDFAVADAYITDVLPEADGRIWLTTRYGGLHCLQPALLQLFTTKDGLSHNSVTSVSPGRGGGLWVGTMRGVTRLREGHFDSPPVDVDLAELNAHAVFEDRAGDVWISASGSTGINLLWLEPTTDGYRRLNVESGVLAGSAFFEDSANRLWHGGLNGLQCLLTNYVTQTYHLLSGREFLGLYVHRKRASRWRILPEEILHIAGDYWHAFQWDRWKPTGSPDEPWQPLAQIPAEHLADAPFPVTLRLPNHDFRAFQQTQDGALWIGTWGGGLLRLHHGQWTTLTTREGLADDQIHCLFEDSENVLWIGTPRGLVRLRTGPGGADEVEGLKSPTSEMDETPAPALLQRFTSSTPFTFTTAHGLPDDEVHQLLEDDAGHLWIGCGEGIYRVARSDLTALAEGRAARIECLLLDSTDGLSAGQTTDGSQPGACRTPDGRLWFATPQGLAAISPGSVQRAAAQPRVVLEMLRAGDREFPLVDGSPHDLPSPGADSLNLPPGSGRSLELQFTALEYAAPKRLGFRYRLEGHDENWVETGSRRAAFFTNLKPGLYRFHVQAAGREKRWIEPGVSLAIAIAPYYWQTGWFRFAVSSCVMLLSLLFLRWRFRVTRRLEHAKAAVTLALQREHLARDLHDDFGSKLTQISLLGELTARDPAQAPRMAAIAREAAQNLDRLVWTVHPERDSLDHLAAYLGEVAREFLAPTGLELRLDYPPTLPPRPLPAPVRKAVLLAVQEALHNVVKHASARRVRLAIVLGKHDFIVTVEDDGQGLPQSPAGVAGMPIREPARIQTMHIRPGSETGAPGNLKPARNGGHGLKNMRRRLTEIGGRCEIESRPCGGIRVRFVVPFSTPSS